MGSDSSISSMEITRPDAFNNLVILGFMNSSPKIEGKVTRAFTNLGNVSQALKSLQMDQQFKIFDPSNALKAAPVKLPVSSSRNFNLATI
jgi:hypothetical protein